MSTIEVKVPALGEFKDVPIIDVLVKPGDAVSKDDALVTLESEKATMDVPSPEAGTVRELKVKVGDRVSEGRVVLTLEAAGAGAEKVAARGEENRPAPAKAPPGAGKRDRPRAAAPTPERAAAPVRPAAQEAAPAGGGSIEVKVPAIGEFKDVPVIDVLVKAGDAVKLDDPLVTLESEKATMDVPSPAAGTVREVKVKAGDHVSEGSLVLVLDAAGAPAAAPSRPAQPAAAPAPAAAPRPRARRGAAGGAGAAPPLPRPRATRRAGWSCRTPRRRSASSRASSAWTSRACRPPARAAGSCTRTCSGS